MKIASIGEVLKFFNLDHCGLSSEVINEKPIDFNFDSSRYSYDDSSEDDYRFSILDHETIENKLRNLSDDSDIIYLENCAENISIGPISESSDGTFNLEINSDENISESTIEYLGIKDICDSDITEGVVIDSYDQKLQFEALCVKFFHLDPDSFDEDSDAYDDQWFPLMNYALPLGIDGCRSTDDWHRAMINCTIVVIGNSKYLALTGGGMDMSWAICETYIRCGYLPPVHYASLPRMAGRGESECDRMIISACYRSFEKHKDMLSSSMQYMEESFGIQR